MTTWLMRSSLCAILLALTFSSTAYAHRTKNNPVHIQTHAVVWGFCGTDKLKSICRWGKEALVVARLESGDFHWYGGHCHRAINGQYHGCFQMGYNERMRYGDSHHVWGQARAAYKYFKASGHDWSPWSCKPWGYCYG